MRYMITGATGFIGSRLVQELMNRQILVNILVRSTKKLSPEIRKCASVFPGDITDKEAVDSAMKNCDFVFHLAGFANIWSKDKKLPYRTNVEGTKIILEAALKNSIKKVVYTSSAGIFPPSGQEKIVNEKSPLPDFYLTDYEKTKRAAEELCIEFCSKGLNTVIVNPSRVYGPGPLNKSNSVTILIKKYIKGTWRFIPGDGKQIGNYAFIDDVVKGHILALEKGTPGEKYILGGTNASYNEFFDTVGEVKGKKYKLFHLPISVASLFAAFELFCADNFGKPPVITPDWLIRYSQNRPVSCQKAIEEIDYSVTPLSEGIGKTILWLNLIKRGNGGNCKK
jgi:nucleoside-diphosphate-sugar epimerase